MANGGPPPGYDPTQPGPFDNVPLPAPTIQQPIPQGPGLSPFAQLLLSLGSGLAKPVQGGYGKFGAQLGQGLSTGFDAYQQAVQYQQKRADDLAQAQFEQAKQLEALRQGRVTAAAQQTQAQAAMQKAQTEAAWKPDESTRAWQEVLDKNSFQQGMLGYYGREASAAEKTATANMMRASIDVPLGPSPGLRPIKSYAGDSEDVVAHNEATNDLIEQGGVFSPAMLQALIHENDIHGNEVAKALTEAQIKAGTPEEKQRGLEYQIMLDTYRQQQADKAKAAAAANQPGWFSRITSRANAFGQAPGVPVPSPTPALPSTVAPSPDVTSARSAADLLPAPGKAQPEAQTQPEVTTAPEDWNQPSTLPAVPKQRIQTNLSADQMAAYARKYPTLQSLLADRTLSSGDFLKIRKALTPYWQRSQ